MGGGMIAGWLLWLSVLAVVVVLAVCWLAGWLECQVGRLRRVREDEERRRLELSSQVTRLVGGPMWVVGVPRSAEGEYLTAVVSGWCGPLGDEAVLSRGDSVLALSEAQARGEWLGGW